MQLEPSEIIWGPRIAVGGFAEVFKARWQGTTVAVKKLLATDKKVAQRHLAEVRVFAKLRHPNLLLFMVSNPRSHHY